ncbi:hypothetical protein [Actinomadura macrotermitis]|uniref:hypothetical protein n=1 Tax=Actinomadura macrotermitis TaxID=2585200 RepID=UPI001F2B7400|nr:hypothetical protein [Actinomadura macrotermitis]
MDEAEACKLVWQEQMRRRDTAEQDRDTLACLIKDDANLFEVELYELAAVLRTLLIIAPAAAPWAARAARPAVESVRSKGQPVTATLTATTATSRHHGRTPGTV